MILAHRPVPPFAAAKSLQTQRTATGIQDDALSSSTLNWGISAYTYDENGHVLTSSIDSDADGATDTITAYDYSCWS
jgi:hypothetical protein